jgi:RpiB/LacA/LacB family sugar-phosphate isomerase
MRVAVGVDHAGFPLKDLVLEIVKMKGHEALDLGTDSTDSVDYPDYAEKVGRAIQQGDADRGILVCGSGVGAAVAANKMIGIRAGLCHDTYSAHQSVEHDNANVLALGARIIGPELAAEIVHEFLDAEFSGEDRHIRRLNKITAIERGDLGKEGE